MKFFIKSFFVFSVFITTLIANEQLQTKTELSNTFDKILQIVQNKALSKDERNTKIVSTIEPIFDFELMAKLSLGRAWKTLTASQQKEFIELYVQRMKKSYSEKVDGYTNEKVEILKILQPKPTRMVSYTQIIGGKTPIKIEYKYYKPKTLQPNKKQWLIYDVVIEGISILKTDRAQFSAMLKRDNITTLIEKLKN